MSDPSRGMSSTTMRHVRCKDCIREVEAGIREPGDLEFTYNESWAKGLIERGGSRSDRCREHRRKHGTNTQGIAVAYIDLDTVGEVADRENPTGPLGGLGPLPGGHEPVPGGVDLEPFGFGMDDSHIREMLEKLSDPERRVLILKAGTGTGKSTFGPYRLMDPPPDVAFRITDLGPIIVTQPRVQAATGVATFVGKVMSGAGGVGPGYPVGYQVSGDRNHDDACQLVYVTDGTLINWMRDGRLSKIGTVIVDEAHERSTNIDFILGYLKRELHRYRHLRVIVTSATFSVPFYEEYFGGPGLVHTMDVPAVKTVGYGMPLFADLDLPGPVEEQRFIHTHWPVRDAPPLTEKDVENPDEAGWQEDLWETTGKLLALRYMGGVIPAEDWKEQMPGVLTDFVIKLARGLDEKEIFGDILGFLPTKRTIEPACEAIKDALGDAADVFPLISSLANHEKADALAARKKGRRRKIVISTNLAETSLTVEGVRFVVDSGIIAQSEWDPDLARGGIPTKPHSQAGMKQRWGRVGRNAPGWVFPLYSESQYVARAEDTPPGSTRDNLESLVMTAKMGGIDDVVEFPWPAAFAPTRTDLDEPGKASLEIFKKELVRADRTLSRGGAVDGDGHPTGFGRELVKFQGLGSIGSALAILYADRLGCVPEVVTVLTLLEDARLVGKDALLLSDYEWPDEWRVEAAERHRGLASICEDDADLVLQICAGWERADPGTPPWEPSRTRRDWARAWWVNDASLLAAAEARRDILQSLSPAMKEDVKRFVEPALLKRTRGVLTRALNGLRYDCAGDSFVAPGSEPETEDGRAQLESDCLFGSIDRSVLALRRRLGRDDERYIGSLVLLEEWALPVEGTDPAIDALRLLVHAAQHAAPDPGRNIRTALVESWPVGQRMRLSVDPTAEGTAGAGTREIARPFARPMTREEGRAEKAERDRSRKAAKLAKTKRAESLMADDDRPEATDEDQSGELDAMRPEAERIQDEEQLAQRAFEEADKEHNLDAPCGRCPQCLSGLEDLCEDPGTELHVGRGLKDALQGWNDRATRNVDVSAPTLVASRPMPANGSGWWEVSGYALGGDGSPIVLLNPDWRAAEAPADPARHRGVEAGQPVDVIVGPKVRDHQDELRTFIRSDGLGRFVLREASPSVKAQEPRSQIAVSLDRTVQGLLADLVEGQHLTATVVASRGQGCFSITLLELLSQHYAAAAPGRGLYMLTADPSKERGDVVEWRTAIVVAPVDAWGNVRVRLSLCDEARGIHHELMIRQPGSPSVQPSSESGEATAAPYAVGSAVAVRVQRAGAELSVSRKDLTVVEEICGHADRSLKLRNEPQRPDARDANGDGAKPWLGGPDTRLVSVGERPLARATAQALATLDDAAGWQHKVWAFWARSHHLRPVSDPAIRPYAEAASVDVPATVTVDETLPLEAKRQAFAAMAERLTPGSDLDGVVKSIVPAVGVFVEVAPRVEGLVRPNQLRWEPVDDPAAVVALGEKVPVRVIDVDLDKPGVALSIRDRLPHPIHAYAADQPPGSTVTGDVERVEAYGVHVRLTPALSGLVHVSELSWRHVDDPNDLVRAGDKLTVHVSAYDFAARRVTLSLKALQRDPFQSYVERYGVGADVTGMVTKLSEQGAVVSLVYGVEGWIPVSEISWQPVRSPADVLTEGDYVAARITAIDTERRRLRLSMKRLAPPPFQTYAARHDVGDHVRARVTDVAEQGVTVELGAERARGWLPVSEMSVRQIHSPAQLVKPGDEIVVAIIKIDHDRSSFTVSLTARLFVKYAQRHVVGDIVAAEVVAHSRRGVRVAVGADRAVPGLVLMRELSHGHVADAADFVRVGQQVKVKIKAFDRTSRLVLASIKDALPPPFEAFARRASVGAVLSGTVTSVKDELGAFVNVAPGVDGLVHKSELSHAWVANASDVISVGQIVRVRILEIDPARRRLRLSIKAAS